MNCEICRQKTAPSKLTGGWCQECLRRVSMSWGTKVNYMNKILRFEKDNGKLINKKRDLEKVIKKAREDFDKIIDALIEKAGK